MKQWMLLCVVLLIAAVAFMAYRAHDRWKPYLQKTYEKPPRPLLREALNSMSLPNDHMRIAIDLGAGAGNETAFLLNAGWSVWAIDASSTAIKMLARRADEHHKQQLHVVHTQFKGINWPALPKADLIVAISSLSFNAPEDFQAVWQKVAAHVKPGGYFVGNFFGSQFSGFDAKDKKQMTWLEGDAVKALFIGFKVLLLRELNQPSQSATGVKTHEHVFEVIAQKEG